MTKIEQMTIKCPKKCPVLNIRVYGKVLIAALPYQIAFIEGIVDSKEKKITEHKMRFKE